ncbi:unnamed protein product, partial [Prorocentrum cordatum]
EVAHGSPPAADVLARDGDRQVLAGPKALEESSPMPLEESSPAPPPKRPRCQERGLQDEGLPSEPTQPEGMEAEERPPTQAEEGEGDAREGERPLAPPAPAGAGPAEESPPAALEGPPPKRPRCEEAAPPKPVGGGFQEYCVLHRKQPRHSGLSGSAVLVRLSEEWKGLTDAEKAPFKEAHEQAMQAWRSARAAEPRTAAAATAEAPRRPVGGGYQQFAAQWRRGDHGGVSAAAKWRELSAEQKAPFREECDRAAQVWQAAREAERLAADGGAAAPRRPVGGGYQQFAAHCRRGGHGREAVAARWRELSAEERAPFREEYDRAVEEYNAAMESWRAAPGSAAAGARAPPAPAEPLVVPPAPAEPPVRPPPAVPLIELYQDRVLARANGLSIRQPFISRFDPSRPQGTVKTAELRKNQSRKQRGDEVLLFECNTDWRLDGEAAWCLLFKAKFCRSEAVPRSRIDDPEHYEAHQVTPTEVAHYLQDFADDKEAHLWHFYDVTPVFPPVLRKVAPGEQTWVFCTPTQLLPLGRGTQLI